MDRDNRMLLRLAATIPLWILRFLFAREATRLWLGAAVVIDAALAVASWRAVVSSAEQWPEHGDPGSVERFIYVPTVLAAVFLFFDTMRLIGRA